MLNLTGRPHVVRPRRVAVVPACYARAKRRTSVARATAPSYPFVICREVRRDGNRNRQVVQRRQGLWLHRPGWGLEGRFRAPLEHRGQRLQEPGRGREGRVRGARGNEGARGDQRRPDRVVAKEEKVELEGEVVEALSNGKYRIALDNGH